MAIGRAALAVAVIALLGRFVLRGLFRFVAAAKRPEVFMAMTLLVAKGFREEDFANLHPGGKLGKRLMRAGQLMHAGDRLPVVAASTPMREVVEEISKKGLGMTCVVEDGRLTLLGWRDIE